MIKALAHICIFSNDLNRSLDFYCGALGLKRHFDFFKDGELFGFYLQAGPGQFIEIFKAGPATEIYHNPRHPYTIALLRSVPRLDLPRRMRLEPVDGQPPDLTRLDGGCAFRPRCRFAAPACAEAKPALTAVGEGGHIAACFRSQDIAAETGRAA